MLGGRKHAPPSPNKNNVATKQCFLGKFEVTTCNRQNPNNDPDVGVATCNGIEIMSFVVKNSLPEQCVSLPVTSPFFHCLFSPCHDASIAFVAYMSGILLCSIRKVGDSNAVKKWVPSISSGYFMHRGALPFLQIAMTRTAAAALLQTFIAGGIYAQ